MNRYLYALVRCVPNPRTGEFVNIAAIAGRPEIGDWSIRQVSNESRVRKLAGAIELEAAHAFLARIGLEIDKQQLLLEEEAGEPLGEGWLQQLYHDHRNVVQLSMPAPIVADNAEHALDILFGSQVIGPVSQPRGFITKHRVLAAVAKLTFLRKSRVRSSSQGSKFMLGSMSTLPSTSRSGTARSFSSRKDGRFKRLAWMRSRSK